MKQQCYFHALRFWKYTGFHHLLFHNFRSWDAVLHDYCEYCAWVMLRKPMLVPHRCFLQWGVESDAGINLWLLWMNLSAIHLAPKALKWKLLNNTACPFTVKLLGISGVKSTHLICGNSLVIFCLFIATFEVTSLYISPLIGISLLHKGNNQGCWLL